MFTLTIETGNAAFEDDLNQEIARILKVTAEKVQYGQNEGIIQDINGNTVGKFTTGE